MKPRSQSPNLSSQEGKYFCQELQGQGSVFSKSNHLLKNSISVISPQLHPTLTTLKQIALDDKASCINETFNNCNIGKHINDPDKDSFNSCRTVQYSITNIAPVGHSNSVFGHTTINTPASPQITYSDNPKDQDDGSRPEESAQQVSKSSSLLSTILKQFDK